MNKIDLKKEFRFVNKLCFNGKLKPIKVKFAGQIWGNSDHTYIGRKRKRGDQQVAAFYSRRTRSITLSTVYKNSIVDLRDTLAHEMLHYKDVGSVRKYNYRYHDNSFRHECKQFRIKIAKQHFAEELAEFKESNRKWKKQRAQFHNLIKRAKAVKDLVSARKLAANVVDQEKNMRAWEKSIYTTRNSFLR